MSKFEVSEFCRAFEVLDWGDGLTSGLRISASLHAGGVSGGVDGNGDPRGERVVRTADATLLVAARDGPGEALEVALAPCLNRSH
jgi:hypothetical protein